MATWYFPLGRKWVKRTVIDLLGYKLLWVFFLTFDILARVLVEGDVLRVDDGARVLVVPAGVISKWDPVIGVLSEISISIF